MKTSEELKLNCCGQGCSNLAEIIAKVEHLEKPLEHQRTEHEGNLEHLAYICKILAEKVELKDDAAVQYILPFVFAQVEICSQPSNMEAAELAATAVSNQYAANKIRDLANHFDDDSTIEDILDYAQAVEDGAPLE